MTTFREYERKLHLLRWLKAEGRDESQEYDALLSEMDILWSRMDENDRDLAKKLSQLTHQGR